MKKPRLIKLLLLTAAGLSLLAVLAIASGCGSQASGSSGGGASLGADKFAQIYEGMTGDQVKAIAGDPARTESKTMSGGHQMAGMQMGSDMQVDDWYYQGSKGWVKIELSDGKVSSKSGY